MFLSPLGEGFPQACHGLLRSQRAAEELARSWPLHHFRPRIPRQPAETIRAIYYVALSFSAVCYQKRTICKKREEANYLNTPLWQHSSKVNFLIDIPKIRTLHYPLYNKKKQYNMRTTTTTTDVCSLRYLSIINSFKLKTWTIQGWQGVEKRKFKDIHLHMNVTIMCPVLYIAAAIKLSFVNRKEREIYIILFDVSI